MHRNTRVFGILTAAMLALSAVGAAPVAAHKPAGQDWVQRLGSGLRLNGQPFRFTGTNNYYLMYSSEYMVDDVLQTAAANGFTVMRTWGWLDIGALDGSLSIQGPKNGVYFQYWDGSAPAYNDGADGLQKLDYVVAKAGSLGLKLVIPFTNDWADFGGMDQYVRWAGGSYHDDFYTNPSIKHWYKNWISHLLNHVNSITGVAYKDDPAIMTWELANEPRCVGSGTYPRSANCTTGTITGWAAEMSAYVKSVDPRHLVSSGSEGFLNIAGSTDGTRNGSDGVDELAISRLPTIDVMSYHLYPDWWSKDAAWSTTWIKDHVKLARAIGKPSMLGEYGWRDKATRNTVFKTWTDAVLFNGGTGALYWILSGHNDDGTLYGDYDGFTVYCPSPVCTTIANFGKAMKNPGLWPRFAPVADDNSAVVEFEQPAVLPVAANDIAYGIGNKVLPQTIDLDPATAGQQKSIAATGGTFALQADGTVLFTPDSGFHGKVSATYTIRDKVRRVSNAAALVVIVKMKPGVPIQLFSFETGTEGWGGSVAQSNAWASDGGFSLLDTAVGGWVSSDFATPLDLSNGYSVITLDALNATETWGFVKISIQAGSGWTWCENTGESLQLGSSGPITTSFDLTTTSCDLSQIHRINLYVSTDTYIDNVWAK
jgi:mannan endo-1,4-beta-mannosidase